MLDLDRRDKTPHNLSVSNPIFWNASCDLGTSWNHNINQAFASFEAVSTDSINNVFSLLLWTILCRCYVQQLIAVAMVTSRKAIALSTYDFYKYVSRN